MKNNAFWSSYGISHFGDSKNTVITGASYSAQIVGKAYYIDNKKVSEETYKRAKTQEPSAESVFFDDTKPNHEYRISDGILLNYEELEKEAVNDALQKARESGFDLQISEKKENGIRQGDGVKIRLVISK